CLQNHSRSERTTLKDGTRHYFSPPCLLRLLLCDNFHSSSEFAFSSSLCDRMMLRHPSASPGIQLKEGCSNTAFGTGCATC
ncbi:MAG: hypothetical protein L0241_05155, partial [Planctomycetia bacterium]|nr:hypothetical protein [Planctomycetia bacterium]